MGESRETTRAAATVGNAANMTAIGTLYAMVPDV